MPPKRGIQVRFLSAGPTKRSLKSSNVLAGEWHTNKLPTWGNSTAASIWRRLEPDIIPKIGAMPIGSITHQYMIAALRKIESRGAQDQANMRTGF
jgi:hypothetical protein